MRARQHAAGTRRQKGSPDEALGLSRGRFSTKVHLRVEGGGKPMALLVTGRQHHETCYLPARLERGKVKRAAQGRPRQRPKRLAGDKSYSSAANQTYLQRRGIGVVIPRRRDQGGPQPRLDRMAY